MIKSHCYSLLLLVVLVSSCSSTLIGGTKGSIKGKVTDPQGLALSGTRVELTNPFTKNKIAALTDREGRYEFAFVDLGDYMLTARHPSFIPVEMVVTIQSSQILSQDIAFQRVRSPEQEVTVTAQTGAQGIDYRSSTSQVLIAPNDLTHLAGGSDSIKPIVRKTPTALVSQEHLHIRGAHQIAYQINGVIVPDLSLFGALTPFINPRTIKFAEIMTGGLLPEFGNRTGGVVNVITRSGFDTERRGWFEIGGGNLKRGSAFLSYGDRIGDRVGYYFEVNGLTSKRGFNPPPFLEDLKIPPRSQTVHNRRKTYENLGNLDFKLSDSSTLTFTFGGYRSDFQIPNTQIQERERRDYIQFERDHFQNLRWLKIISGNKLLDVAVYHHFNRVEVDGRNDRPLVASDNRRVNYYGTRADFSMAIGRHFVKAGGDAYLARLRDGFTIFALQPGTPFASFRSAVPVLGKEQSAYVQDQIDVTDNLTLNLGLRFDAFEAKRSDFLVGPRIGASYKIPNTQVVLFGSFGRLFLPPPVEFFDITATSRDSQDPEVRRFSDEFTFVPVRPEIDTQYEAGVKFPLRGFKTKFTQWYKHQKNFLDHEQLEHPSGDVNIFLPVNVKRARSWGVETFVETPRYKGLNLYINYSLYYAQGKGGIIGGLIKRREEAATKFFFLDHDQRHTLSVGVEYLIERYKAWINGNFRAGSGFPDASNTFTNGRLPGHAILDLAIGKTFFNHWEARLELENLTNKIYPINLSSEFNGSHYSPPRLITFRMGYRF